MTQLEHKDIVVALPSQQGKIMTVDHRQLLKKYMALVLDCEGVTMVDAMNDVDPSEEPFFNEDEADELEAIKREVLR